MGLPCGDIDAANPGLSALGPPHVALTRVTCYHPVVPLDERAFFTERPEQRPGQFACPRCRRSHEYPVRWVRRIRKPQPPPQADGADRARWATLRDHLLRLDDEVTCKSCSKRFEIPSQQSLVFLDQLDGLPNDAELDAEIAAAESDAAAPPAPKGPLPARFSRPSRGWRG